MGYARKEVEILRMESWQRETLGSDPNVVNLAST